MGGTHQRKSALRTARGRGGCGARVRLDPYRRGGGRRRCCPWPCRFLPHPAGGWGGDVEGGGIKAHAREGEACACYLTPYLGEGSVGGPALGLACPSVRLRVCGGGGRECKRHIESGPTCVRARRGMGERVLRDSYLGVWSVRGLDLGHAGKFRRGGGGGLKGLASASTPVRMKGLHFSPILLFALLFSFLRQGVSDMNGWITGGRLE